ncbi:MAG: putative porin [Nitrospiraceae bacterium]|nr:putative porin [Nitrospiraceae bacterium]MDA8091384.1 putative porin [Nitrospiraceae bacterium]
MKRGNENKAVAVRPGAKGYVCAGIMAMFLLIVSGCAGIPGKINANEMIKNESTSARTGFVNSGTVRRDMSGETGLEALVDLLKEKNVISADDVARFSGKGLTGQDLAELVALLKQKNVISEEEAARFTGQKNQEPTPIATGVEDGALVTQANKKDLEKIKTYIAGEVRSDVKEALPTVVKETAVAGNAPNWTNRLRFGGDIRLRYENDRFDPNNTDLLQPNLPTQLMNTRINQNRFKYRVRIGADAKVNENVNAVVQLSSGNTSTPVSINDTMGNYFERGEVLFNLAYLQWRPWYFLTVTGGRLPNPFFSSDLVWARDLTFEGLVFNFKEPVMKDLTPFLTAGAFPLNHYDFSSSSKWLVAGQAGVVQQNPKGIGYSAAVAYYDFTNITGRANSNLNPNGIDDNDWTAPQFQQKGNSLFDINAGVVTSNGSEVPSLLALASEFRELDLMGTLDIGFWDPYHVVLLGDYVKNVGFNVADVAQRAGFTNSVNSTGYQLGIAVGYPLTLDWGQWRAYLSYKRLGSDAVVDAFTDTDFHLGGTNAKGWILGADAGLYKDTWLTLRWLTADEVGGPPLAIDVFQLDFNAKF